ncbi:GIY-YIG nuclease family protein [Patescibacteria group bacterium]
MYYVYLIQSQKDFSTYIGHTEDLRKRFKEHNQGRTKSIKYKVLYKLIYYEAFLSKVDARKREIELKKKSFKKENLFIRLENSFKVYR